MSAAPALRCLAVLLILLAVAGCAGRPSAFRIEAGQGLELEATPFFAQKAFQCGPASLAMILGASGVSVAPEALVPHTFLPGRRGSLQLELIGAGRRHGRIPYVIEPGRTALLAELQAGRPVLVLQNLGLKILPAFHYAVVIGAVPDAGIVLRSGTTRRLIMPADQFLATWERAGSWGIILLRPGELPARPDPADYLDAVSAFEASGGAAAAEPAYLAAQAAWPENHTVLFALANNYLLQGRYREAGSRFATLLSFDPDHVAAANNLAETLARRGCYDQAATVIARASACAERLSSPLTATISQTRQEIARDLAQQGSPSRHCDDFP